MRGEKGWAHSTAPQSHFPVEVFPDDRHWGETRQRRTEQHSPKHREDRGRGKKEGRGQEHVLFWNTSTWHRLKYQASWQEEQRDWAVFISSALDRKAQPRKASRLALHRSACLIVLSTAGPPGDGWSDRHVTDRNNHFLAAPGVDWTFCGRS